MGMRYHCAKGALGEQELHRSRNDPQRASRVRESLAVPAHVRRSSQLPPTRPHPGRLLLTRRVDEDTFLSSPRGVGGTRTRDLLYAIQVRYQLRHDPILALHVLGILLLHHSEKVRYRKLEVVTGVEPA